MNIKSSLNQVSHAPLTRPATPQQAATTAPTDDSFSFSSQNDRPIYRLGRGFGGAVAGSLFGGLLLTLPLSLGPALGVEKSTVLSAYGAAVLTCGVAGGLASAVMPPEENWY